MRLALIALACCSTSRAAESVLAARAADYQAQSRIGRFEIRANLQGAVDLTIEGTSVAAEVFTGSEFTGAAAIYTQPLPRALFRDFRAIAIGSAKVKVLEPPSRENAFRARVRIESKQLKLANIRLLWEADTAFQGTSLPAGTTGQDNALTGRMELTGRFANDVELRVRANEVQADGPFVLHRLRLTQPLPKTTAKFRVQGKAEIIETPSAANRYTATIRIRKVKPAGEDRSVTLIWTR